MTDSKEDIFVIETSKIISPKLVETMQKFWAARAAKQDSLLGAETTVSINKGKAKYIAKDGKTVKKEGCATLLAMLEFSDDQQNCLWTWGHVLKDSFNGPCVEKKEFKRFYSFMNNNRIRMPGPVMMVATYKCALEYKFDHVEEITFDSDPNEVYIMGITQIKQPSPEQPIKMGAT